MDFTTVLLICTAGIALCAALVFLVETVVAFWLHDQEQIPTLSPRPIPIDGFAREMPTDKAA